MFFEGTLQEGIAFAVKDAKLVVCFVTNDGDESKLWENEYLTDSSIAAKLQSEAVLLRLIAGSDEAKYLAAIFPLPKTPTLVLIRNGELKEYIAAGVSRDDFLTRMQKVLGVAPAAPSHPEPAELSAPQIHVGVGHRSSSAADASASAAAGTTSSPATLAPEASNRHSSSSQNTPSSSSYGGEQASEPEKKAGEAEKEHRRQEKGKWRAESDSSSKEEEQAQEKPAAASAASSVGLAREEVKKATEAIKKRKLDSNDERRRILQQIEHDRIARRQREEERRAQRQAALTSQQEDDDDSGELVGGGLAAAAPGRSTGSRSSPTCALQVRDFDGSTIRTRLPSGSTLGKEVRQWVDENRPIAAEGGRAGPYTFKLVLTPLPNRTIDETEESQSLQDLGLTPSSSLILVPVQKKYAAAYGAGQANADGFFARIVAFFMGIINSIALFFQTLFSTQGPPAPPSSEQGQPGSSSPLADRRAGVIDNRQNSARVSGFRNPADDRRDQQLYNGNSLNFEPRPDDEEEITN